MAFTVAVEYLLIGAPGKPTVSVPADRMTLAPPKLKRNWKTAEGFGVDGSFCWYTSQGLGVFSVVFDFWTESMEPSWVQFAAAYLSAPAGRPDVLSIYHPVLALPPYYINNVVVTDLEGWSQTAPGSCHWQTRVEFMQYKKQKAFPVVKAEPTVPPVPKPAPAKPLTAQDVELQSAAADVQSLIDADKGKP